MRSSKIKLQLLISSPDISETISLEGEEFIFGRNPESTVHLNDTAFSRSHFKLHTDNSQIILTDLGASNGTFINDVKVDVDNPVSINFDEIISTENSLIKIKILDATWPNHEVIDTTATHKSLFNKPLGSLGITSLDLLSEEIIREAELRVEQIISKANLEAQEFMTQAQAKSDKLIADKQALANQSIEKENLEKKIALNKELEQEKEKKLSELQLQVDIDKKLLEAELEQYRLSVISKHDKRKQELNLEINGINSKISKLEKKFAAETEKQNDILDKQISSKKNELAEYIKNQDEEKDKLFKQIEEQYEKKRFELQAELDIYEERVVKAELEFSKLEKNLALEADNQRSILDQKILAHEVELSEFINRQEEEKNKVIEKIEAECEEVRAHLQADLAHAKQEIANAKAEFLKLEKKFELELDNQKDSFHQQVLDQKNELAELISFQEEEKQKSFLFIEAQYENKRFELQAELEVVQGKLSTARSEFSVLYDNYNKKKLIQTQTLDDLVAEKNLISKEIVSLEEELSSQKILTTNFLADSKSSIKLMQTEVDKISKIKAEVDNSFKLSKDALIELETNLSDVRLKVKAEQDLIQQKQQQQLLMEDKTNKLHAEQSEILNSLTPLKNELHELTKKNDLASRLNAELKNEHNRDVTGLQASFLQMKKDLDAEMLKLKIIEEERLQNLTRHELNQINKIKEDSLRIVLDLEDSITKELTNATSKVFATTIGMAKFNEIAPDFEKSVRSSLQTGVLKLLKNELNPTDPFKKKTLSSTKQAWKPLAIGMSLSAIIFGGIPMIYRQVQEQNDPARIQREADARLAALPVIKKFIVTKNKKIGASFVESIIYTENYYETITQEKFRSGLMKEGSVYMFKQWNITEEKSIQGFSMILSLLDNLHEKAEKIDPDYEKRDIKKMEDLEKETIKKLESILGNAVRLEAAIKFQNRFYEDYVLNEPAI